MFGFMILPEKLSHVELASAGEGFSGGRRESND